MLLDHVAYPILATRGGKTHTVLGAGAERGMYSHAADALLRELSSSPGQFLSVTVCEVPRFGLSVSGI